MDSLQSKQLWITCFFQWSYLAVICLAKGPPLVNRTALTHKQLIAYTGKNYKIPCPVVADPPAIMEWSKEGQPIHSGWERFKVVDTGLRIKETETEDTGYYNCKATNGYGSVSINFTLTVLSERKDKIQQNNLYPNPQDPEAGAEPKFIHLNKMKQNKIPRPVGSSIRFKCKATGVPQPEVRWLKDGQIWVSEDVGSYQDSRLRWTLKINDLQEEDSGKYTCIVTNLYGTINYTYILEVVEKVHDKPEFLPPHPLNQTVRHGEQASFQCHVKSDAQPHITWLKGVDDPSALSSLNHTIEVKGSRFVVLKSGQNWKRPDGSYVNKLIIKRATLEDSGMYICLGASSFGYSIRPAFLQVQPDPINPHPYHPTKKQPMPNSDTNNNNNIYLAILIPLVLILLIMATVCLCLRCRSNYSDTSNTSSMRHIQHVAVPTHNKDFPSATYQQPPPSLSAYHTTMLTPPAPSTISGYHGPSLPPPGSSSMSGGSTCRIASSVPQMRH